MATLLRRAACVSSGHQLPIMPATIAVRHAEQPHRDCKASAWTFRHAGPATAAQQTWCSCLPWSATSLGMSNTYGFCFLSLLLASKSYHVCVRYVVYYGDHFMSISHAAGECIHSITKSCMHAALLTPAPRTSAHATVPHTCMNTHPCFRTHAFAQCMQLHYDAARSICPSMTLILRRRR